MPETEYNSVGDLLESVRQSWAGGILNKVRTAEKDDPGDNTEQKKNERGGGFLDQLNAFVRNNTAVDGVNDVDDLYVEMLNKNNVGRGGLLDAAVNRDDVIEIRREAAVRTMMKNDFFPNHSINTGEFQVLGPLIAVVDYVHEQAKNYRDMSPAKQAVNPQSKLWQDMADSGGSVSGMVLASQGVASETELPQAVSDAAASVSGFSRGEDAGRLYNRDGTRVAVFAGDDDVHVYDNFTKGLESLADRSDASSSPEQTSDVAATEAANAADVVAADVAVYDRVEILDGMPDGEQESAIARARSERTEESEATPDEEGKEDEPAIEAVEGVAK